MSIVAGTTLGAIALTGLLGGLGHCTGMCGPLVALAGIKLRERRASVTVAAGVAAPGLGTEATTTDSGRADARPGDSPHAGISRFMVGSTLAYHCARVVVYAALGAVVGSAGSLLGAASGVTTLGAVVSLDLGAAVLTLGLGYVGLLPSVARERGARWWGGAASWALRRPGLSGPALLGAVNGLLPCGLVYGALLVSAGTGSTAGGALCMLAFGVAWMLADGC